MDSMAPAQLKRWRDRVRSHRSELLYTRLLAVVLGLWALTASAGWLGASANVRIAIPPQLPYGGTFQAGVQQPWQVFNFAGYIWQQYNTWPEDGERDAAANLQRLAAFFTAAARAGLDDDLRARQRRGEMAGRIRNVRPVGLYRPELVRPDPGWGGDSWWVQLDLEVQESLHGVSVRTGTFRYQLRVVAADLDPERNPWGLLIAERQAVLRLPPSDGDRS